MKENSARRARGLAMYKKLGWGTNEGLKSVDEEVWGLTTDFILGDVWSRPGLSKKTRSMLNLAMLAALNRGPELKLHVNGALTNGLTKEEIKEIFLQVAIYCGIPAGLDAFKTARDVFKERGV